MFTPMKEPVMANGRMLSGHYLNFTPTSELWPFERGYSAVWFTQLLQSYWWITVIISALYAVAIHAGQKYMASRKPLQLTLPLILWNAGLAIFSCIGAARMFEQAYQMYQHSSPYEAVCYTSQPSTAYGFWSEAFMWSKIVELGDTLFIVTRKRPLIFLHWYHHVTVLIFSWHSCREHSAPGQHFILMNMTVHTIMYAYYALRACRIRLPKFVAMFVTGIQTLQMVGGITIGVLVYRYKMEGRFCRQSWQNFILGLLIYGTYFVLFVRFFVHAYILRTPAKPITTSTTSSDTNSQKQQKIE